MRWHNSHVPAHLCGRQKTHLAASAGLPATPRRGSYADSNGAFSTLSAMTLTTPGSLVLSAKCIKCSCSALRALAALCRVASCPAKLSCTTFETVHRAAEVASSAGTSSAGGWGRRRSGSSALCTRAQPSSSKRSSQIVAATCTLACRILEAKARGQRWQRRKQCIHQHIHALSW